MLLPRLSRTQIVVPSVRERLHFGMAEFHDNPSEYWHSHAWSFSIRTTSDQYAHSSLDAQPLFPSDFVSFKCGMLECVCLENEQESLLGRILKVDRDYRSLVSVKGVVTLKIQRVLEYQHTSTRRCCRVDRWSGDSYLGLFGPSSVLLHRGSWKVSGQFHTVCTVLKPIGDNERSQGW